MLYLRICTSQRLSDIDIALKLELEFCMDFSDTILCMCAQGTCTQALTVSLDQTGLDWIVVGADRS